MIPNTIVPSISAARPKMAMRARFRTPVKLISAASAMIAIAINYVSFSVGVKPNKAPT